MTALLEPARIGDLKLSTRIVMPPMTRMRAHRNHVPIETAALYYAQRAGTPGTLLISEGTFIREEAGGLERCPGIWSQEQIDAWRKIGEAVHAKGSYMFMQIWAMGRGAFIDHLAADAAAAGLGPSGYPFVSSGNVPAPSQSEVAPRPLTRDEIQEYVRWYAAAAKNAVAGAGLDGIELHGANGYLIEQFLSTASNNRSDEYGGSIENRCRFALEVVAAVCEAVGQKRVGLRMSPWSYYIDNRMPDPVPTYSYLLSELRKRFPDLAYIHVVEARVEGPFSSSRELKANETLQFAREIWKGRPLILAGGYMPESAREVVEKGVAQGENLFVAFGRRWVSNPDLVERVKNGHELAPYTRATFYVEDPVLGYTDYPFYTLPTEAS